MTTLVKTGNNHFSIRDCNLQFVAILSPEPKEAAVNQLEGGDPHEERHALGERPFVVGEQHLNAIIFVIIDKVEVGRNVPFLQPSIQQPKAVPDQRHRELFLVVKLREGIGDKFEFGCA